MKAGEDTPFPAVDGPQVASGEERCSDLLRWRKVPSPMPGWVACSPMEALHLIHWHGRLCPYILVEKVVIIHPHKPERRLFLRKTTLRDYWKDLGVPAGCGVRKMGNEGVSGHQWSLWSSCSLRWQVQASLGPPWAHLQSPDDSF